MFWSLESGVMLYASVYQYCKGKEIWNTFSVEIPFFQFLLLRVILCFMENLKWKWWDPSFLFSVFRYCIDPMNYVLGNKRRKERWDGLIKKELSMFICVVLFSGLLHCWSFLKRDRTLIHVWQGPWSLVNPIQAKSTHTHKYTSLLFVAVFVSCLLYETVL